MMSQGHLIGVDWGSSSFRAWLISKDGEVAGTLVHPRGILFAEPENQRAWLGEVLARWQEEFDVEGIYCVGMVGSRTGILETPYVPLPADQTQWKKNRLQAGEINGAPLWIYPGLSFFKPGSDDVLRGEEFLAFAIMAGKSDASTIVCPGTHSKWIQRSGNSVIGFQTFVTGELFSLWSRHSSIASYVSGEQTSRGIEIGFQLAQEVNDVITGLFPIRAGLLSGRIHQDDLSGALSGLLVGREVLDGLAITGNPSDVTLVADGALLDVYSQAFAVNRVKVRTDKINMGEAFRAIADFS